MHISSHDAKRYGPWGMDVMLGWRYLAELRRLMASLQDRAIEQCRRATQMQLSIVVPA